MNWCSRLASKDDVPQLEELIPRSTLALQKDEYTLDQIRAALGSVFAVDVQLIEDGTYFVVEDRGKIIGCGGWSHRPSLYGGRGAKDVTAATLDPESDPARIRAFFTDSAYARRGVGGAILDRCERAIASAGFSCVEICATLVGEKLYLKNGYESLGSYKIPLTDAKPMIVVRMGKQLGERRRHQR